MPEFDINIMVELIMPAGAGARKQVLPYMYAAMLDNEKTFTEMKREVVQQFFPRPIPKSIPTILWHDKMKKYVDEHFSLSYSSVLPKPPRDKNIPERKGLINDAELISEHLDYHKTEGKIITKGYRSVHWLGVNIYLLPHKDILTIKPPPPCPQINALVASHSDPNSHLSSLPTEIVCHISKYMGGNIDDSLKRMNDFDTFKNFKGRAPWVCK